MKDIKILLAMMAGVLPQHMRSLPAKKRHSTRWAQPHQGAQECARRHEQLRKSILSQDQKYRGQ